MTRNGFLLPVVLLALAFGSSADARPALAQQNASARAPTTFAVGDPQVDGTHLQPFEVVWLATPYSVEGEAGAANRIVETIEVVGASDDRLLRFTQVWYDTLGSVVFTTVRVAQHATMAYRAFHSGGAPGAFGHLDFEEERVSGFFVEGAEGPTLEFALAFDAPVFASMGGLLLAALPLEIGLDAEYPRFGWGGNTNPTSSAQRIRVVGLETIPVVGQDSVEGYKVSTQPSPGSEINYWITRTAPYFVKAESRGPSGSRIFEVESWRALP